MTEPSGLGDKGGKRASGMGGAATASPLSCTFIVTVTLARARLGGVTPRIGSAMTNTEDP